MHKILRAVIDAPRKEDCEAYPYLAFLLIGLIIALCHHVASV